MFSTPTSRWTGGAAAVCLGLVAVTYVAVVGPKRGEAADLADATATAQQQNDRLQIETAQLRAQFAALPQKQAELSEMLTQLPVTADMPHFLRTLDTMASAAGVSLDVVSPAAPAYVGSQGGDVAAATQPATPATATAGGMKTVQVPVTITVHGPYFKAVTFLKKLQSGQRAFLVGGLQVAVADGAVTLTVRGSVFALPGAAQALAAAAPATPAPTPAPAP